MTPSSTTRIRRVSRGCLGAKLGLLLALAAEWAAGSACLTPQVTKEVQMARPLPPKTTETAMSGGVTWGVTGVGSMGVPDNPNADVNVLVRHAPRENREVQVPVNLSIRLGPGVEDATPLGIHLSSGLLFKKAIPISAPLPEGGSLAASSGENGRYRAHRPLYNAWVFGPTLGMLAAYGTDEYGDVTVEMSYDSETGEYWESEPEGRHQPEMYPLSPFGGFYLRFIHEWISNWHGESRIKSSGFLASAHVFPTEFLANGGDPYPVEFYAPIEVFLGGIIGSERQTHLRQTVIGISYHRIYGPQFVVGFVFGGYPIQRGRS